ncbi:MAG TPA: OmpA family protein [Terracidiphilus sp.]|nr:OmpA family protein [Terracidiphilus sp.]
MSARNHKGHVSHERWLISFADFITLLFSLFVVLYAFAQADQKKQTDVTAAIDTAFRTMGVFGQASPGSAQGANEAARKQATEEIHRAIVEELRAPAKVKDDLENIRRDLQRRLSNQVAQHTVSIELGRDGLVISLREAGFFDSASATPRPETLPTLRQIAASLNQAPYDVRVEGHTDNVPMHNAEFDSNWELSSARATRIARMLLDMKAISPDRLSASGYAEFHPVAENDTAEGRAKNRRVDLVVMPRAHLDLAGSATPQPNAAPAGWRRIDDQ